MLHLTAALLLVAIAFVAHPALSATILIENGLAPPHPANVIDAANSHPSDRVVVNNVGCGTLVVCEDPGAPTVVEIAEGGVVGDSLLVNGTSAVLVSGGSIPRNPEGIPDAPVRVLGADGSATVTITGGHVGALVLFGSSAATVSGGSVTTADVSGSLTVRGGILGSILAYGGGTVRIFGSGFAIDGVPAGLGEVEPAMGALTGTLLSRDPLDLVFSRVGFGEFPPGGILILVPEPSTALLAGLGLGVLSVLRRAAPVPA